jgi:hypothetical protein
LATENYIPDPIHDSIEMPTWFLKIKEEKSIRRMMFIRQLGLKAYIDYPGAIHTRYSHVQGVMHLAGRMVDMLHDYEDKKGHAETATNLKRNKATIMAAGFLHDIGHGPFSHVCDYVLEKFSGKKHEVIGAELISQLKVLENEGMPIKSIQEIITGRHCYPFLSHIINGPLDADKLDYLLRDAYHVGLKYSFDLNYFIKNFRILGNDKSKLEHCELGLENLPKAIVTAEIFVVIWKSMYDLVYHVENSRMAEKMLEKALLLRAENDKSFKELFKNTKKFVEIHDEKLLDELRSKTDFAGSLAEGVANNQLFEIITDIELSTEKFKFSETFTSNLEKDPDQLSDHLSIELAKKLKFDKYKIICDIIKSKAPKDIHVNEYVGPDPVELKSKSSIVASIKPNFRLKIYVDKSLKQKVGKDLLTTFLTESIGNESSGRED